MGNMRTTTMVAIFVGMLLMLFPASVTAREPQVAASAASGLYTFDLAVGNRGYAAMAWSAEAADSKPGRYRANVFTRTRLPGLKRFHRRGDRRQRNNSRCLFGNRRLPDLLGEDTPPRLEPPEDSGRRKSHQCSVVDRL